MKEGREGGGKEGRREGRREGKENVAENTKFLGCCEKNLREVSISF